MARMDGTSAERPGTGEAPASQGGASRGSKGSWVAVALIVVGVIALGLALILQLIWLAVVGGVITLAGVGIGLRAGIMEDVH